MKIENSKAQQFLQKYKDKSHPPGDKKFVRDNLIMPSENITLSKKTTEHFKIKNNSPDDPQVSTKVLDSLNSSMINFSQDQRDTLATILSNRATQVKNQRESAS